MNLQKVYLTRFENLLHGDGRACGPVISDTGVKFLFFMPRNMERPLVRTTFRYWKFDDSEEEVYMVPGVTDPKKYIYAYMKSELYYFVRNINVHLGLPNVRQPTSHIHAEIDEVEIVNEGAEDMYKAYIGNHLDISIHRLKKHPTMFLATHKTVYTEEDNPDQPTSFFRDASRTCNFDLVPKQSGDDWSIFAQTQCQNSGGYTGMTLRSTYNNDVDIKFISAIVDWLTSTDVHSGGRKASTKRYVMLKEGRRSIKQHGGCSYITLHKRNVYLHQGGAREYNGVSFMSNTCIHFLSKYVFAPVYSKKPDMEGIRVFFDEFNELAPHSNDYITVVYDFMGKTSTIFRMETVVVLTCAYIEKKQSQQHSYILNEHEMLCKSGFDSMMRSLTMC